MRGDENVIDVITKITRGCAGSNSLWDIYWLEDELLCVRWDVMMRWLERGVGGRVGGRGGGKGGGGNYLFER